MSSLTGQSDVSPKSHGGLKGVASMGISCEDSPTLHRRLTARKSGGSRGRRNYDEWQGNYLDPMDEVGNSSSHPWGQRFSISKKPVTSGKEFLIWLAEDITKTVDERGRMHDNMFFNIALGGNVRVVRDMLRYLKQRNMTNELRWILGPDTLRDRNKCSLPRRVFNSIVYLFWAMLFIILTPIFYTFHMLTFNMHLRSRGRMSRDIQLSLVFAVFSEDPDMIRVMLRAGCPLESQDPEGNNIYHYLADLSQDLPDKAVQCHYILCECVDNLDILRTLITEQTNDLGITAMEAIAKYGSMHFLRIIMLDKSCIGNLRLSVSRDCLWADVPEHTFDIRPMERQNSTDIYADATLNVLEFDISRYEKGDTCKYQSYLLQLVASRSVESMSELDLWALIQSKLLEKWISIKRSGYLAWCVWGHILYTATTALLLAYVVKHGGDMQQIPNLQLYYRYDIENVLGAGEIMMRMANKSTPANTSIYDYTCLGWTITLEEKYTSVLMHDVIVDNCSSSALLKVIEGCGGMEPEEVISMLQRGYTNAPVGFTPMAISLTTILVIEIVVKMVISQGFLWGNFHWRATKLFNTVRPALIRRFPGSYTEKHLSAIMYIFFAAFIEVTLLKNAATKREDNLLHNYWDIMSNNTRRREEPKQVEKLANALRTQMDTVAELDIIVSNMMIICLMVRFLHTIHSMRLLPGIGFFVITTKKMAKHLMQFAIVFAIVSLAFATIFYFVMRKIECPAQKVDGFDSLPTSLFSTYQVALGYGEYDFTNNLNARIAYVAYTITSILLLLNLIIAVMTTTAEELNRTPWKEALCCLEQWDELLGVEITVRIICFPVSKIWCLMKKCYYGICRRGDRAWKDIKRTAKKTIEVTFLK